MQIDFVEIGNILTRAGGFLKTVSSHSAQPYRGCSFGNSLCGVGCYVQHYAHLTRGRRWGGFLEVRRNAADSYRRNYPRERAWARRSRGRFTIFLSSSTEPFLPQEFRYRITRGLLEAMLELPPDELIVQTHSQRVVDYLGLLAGLGRACRLRVHVSIESDRDQFPGLPRSPNPVSGRLEAAKALKASGIQTVITVAPLLPIRDPERFFRRVAECAHAVVIDHFIQGDGTPQGTRTARTPLPAAMEAVLPGSSRLAYRDEMVRVAQRFLPGRVGVNVEGFAGRYLDQQGRSRISGGMPVSRGAVL